MVCAAILSKRGLIIARWVRSPATFLESRGDSVWKVDVSAARRALSRHGGIRHKSDSQSITQIAQRPGL